MSLTEQFEILKAVVAVATADGTITSSEKGVITALAERMGLGRRSLQALIERAAQDKRMHEEVGRYTIGDREKAMELLVGAARIDGEIADEEREQLAAIAVKLGISTDRFAEVYSRGVATADRLRAAKLG